MAELGGEADSGFSSLLVQTLEERPNKGERRGRILREEGAQNKQSSFFGLLLCEILEILLIRANRNSCTI